MVQAAAMARPDRTKSVDHLKSPTDRAQFDEIRKIRRGHPWRRKRRLRRYRSGQTRWHVGRDDRVARSRRNLPEPRLHAEESAAVGLRGRRKTRRVSRSGFMPMTCMTGFPRAPMRRPWLGRKSSSIRPPIAFSARISSNCQPGTCQRLRAGNAVWHHRHSKQGLRLRLPDVFLRHQAHALTL
jgi:hypothetical protein